MRLGRASCLALLLSLCSSDASALMQPDGTVIPSQPGCRDGRPTGLLSEFACVCDQADVCNIGPPCPAAGQCDPAQYATCESRMWHEFNDNTCIPSNAAGLDPVVEAAVTPETYRPACGLTFTVRSRGTARFKNAFGWYNVTGQAPSPDDLHVMLDCNAQRGDRATLDLRSDPAYRGGEVAFFLVTPEDRGRSGECAGGDCCASVDRLRRNEGYAYFSEARFNPDQRGAASFIHLIIYSSHVTPNKFFFAWEDTFNAPNNDFTDLLTSVEGIEAADCAGGGMRCATGEPGICAHGVQSCGGAASTCIRLYAPEAERCDGFDNDCDGTIDEDVDCGAGRICHNGRCTPHCSGGEFECPPGFDCDPERGHCFEVGCQGMTCGPGQLCRGGRCVAECEGVLCPRGQRCYLDTCVEPCAGVRCDGGKVCKDGVCVPPCNQCNGLVCAAPETCAADGQCKDPACPATCPQGTSCRDGQCRDTCEGAVCPAGQACCRGQCTSEPEAMGCDAAGGGGGSLPGGGGSGGGAPGAGGSGGGSPGSGAGNPAGREGNTLAGAGNGACACQLGGRPGPAGPLVLVLELALALVVRRRHR